MFVPYKGMNVQIPPPEIFDSSCLQWAIVHNDRSKYKVMRQAFIPWVRVNDFIQGEARIGKFPTTFKISSSHRRKSNELTKRCPDAWLETKV